MCLLAIVPYLVMRNCQRERGHTLFGSRTRLGLRRRQKNATQTTTILASMLLILSSSQIQSQISVTAADSDGRCFLDGGGATESFFIKESLPVGSLLGTLRVIGDIGQDISLALQADEQEDAPIAIEESTKNVILAKSLDKEGETGPSSIVMHVVCQRLGTEDPDFTIPINIRVTDVNDNAPQFLGGPYNVNVSELALVGSAIFQDISARDRDQPGPFSTIEYGIEPDDSFSDHLTFLNPLEGTLYLAQPLDYETIKSFEVRLVARDQGSPPQESFTILRVNVQDADDQNPNFFFDQYHALLPESNTEGQKLMVQPQDLRAFDKDQGLASPLYYAFNGQANEYKYFELNRNSGHIYIKSNIPDDEFLRPFTLVVKATQFDNPDRYAVTTLTISRGGIFDSALQFLQRSYTTKILENVPLNSVITTLLTNKPSDRRVQFQIEESSLPGQEFSVSQRGDILVRKLLDFERVEDYAFKVLANDGRHNDSALVNVTLLNINDWDPRFKYPQYEFYVSENNAFQGHTLGRLQAHDGDKGDRVSLKLKGPHARLFRISPRGDLTIDDTKYLNGSEAHLVVVAEDSGVPPRSSSVPVVVHFAQGAIRGLQTAQFDQDQLMLALALVLVLLFVIIISLMIYICKHKRKYTRTSPPGSRDSLVAQKAARMNSLHNGHSHGGLLFPPPTGEGGHSHYVLSPPRHLSPPRSVDNRLANPLSSDRTRSNSSQTSVVLNPLNPRSGIAGHRLYSPKGGGLIRISHSPMPLYSSVGQASPSSMNSGPPPPTPSIHSNGLPEGRYSSSNPGRENKPATQLSVVISSHPNGPSDHQTLGSINSVLSSSASSQAQDHWFDTYASNKRSLTETLKHSSFRDLSRIEWPRNSIPRRVKKLSWDDEMYRDRHLATLTDPTCSVTPLHERTSTPTEEGDLGRTMYF